MGKANSKNKDAKPANQNQETQNANNATCPLNEKCPKTDSDSNNKNGWQIIN